MECPICKLDAAAPLGGVFWCTECGVLFDATGWHAIPRLVREKLPREVIDNYYAQVIDA